MGTSTEQTAAANTGGNHATSGPPGPDRWRGSGDVRTGTATAIGSQDATQFDQQAVAELTGDATAEIVQIAIVFNIGGAAATTGSNQVDAPGNGAGAAITTGDATAIGNDSQTYVTQGAGVEAGTGRTEAVTQRVMTLHIGVATSDTGHNTIVAAMTGGDAGVATGDATAIGNQSSSTVDQIALAVGNGSAELSIEQRAMIVNLGLALANTGENTIGDVIGAALDLDDPESARRLVELVVPQLVAAANTGGGGAISTGDASAIGNRSTTELQQIALGTADSGAVWVDQSIVVVNAGMAIANTGHNQIGAKPAPLDGETETAVTQLSTFLGELLGAIDTWAEGGDAELDSSSLTTTIGGVTISIDGSLVPSTGDVDALATTIRQLTAVINLAAALSSSGENTTIVVDDQSGAATSGGDGNPAGNITVGSAVIVTGDATAANGSVVMVCQLHGIEGVECLAPDAPSDVSAAEPAPEPAASGVETLTAATPPAATTATRSADAARREAAGLARPSSTPERAAGPAAQVDGPAVAPHDAAPPTLVATDAVSPDGSGDGTTLLALISVVALCGALAGLIIVRRRLV